MVHIGERKVESKWLTKVCAEMLSTHVNEQHGDPRAMAWGSNYPEVRVPGSHHKVALKLRRTSFQEYETYQNEDNSR